MSLQHAPLGKSEEHSSGIPNTPKKLADLLAPPGKDLYFAILIRVKHCFQHIPIKKKKTRSYNVVKFNLQTININRKKHS